MSISLKKEITDLKPAKKNFLVYHKERIGEK